MNDEKLVSDVFKHIEKHRSLRDTYKSVEGVDVIHDNNKILIQLRLGAKPSCDTIKY